MINVEQTIISQYANSPILVQLIQGINQYIDPRADIDNFYNTVWNVDTAQGFGLDIWGRIVGVSRLLQIPETNAYMGFNEARPGAYAFNDAPMWDGTPPATNAYFLADSAYRTLILTKAMANILQPNAPALNQLLQNFFAGRGRAYVNDLGGMAFRYVFEFDLTPYEYAIITQSSVFPRPAGVQVLYFHSAMPLFGFSETGYAAPFDQGVFLPAGAMQ